jgi:hypothetical protein
MMLAYVTIMKHFTKYIQLYSVHPRVGSALDQF